MSNSLNQININGSIGEGTILKPQKEVNEKNE